VFDSVRVEFGLKSHRDVSEARRQHTTAEKQMLRPALAVPDNKSLYNPVAVVNNCLCLLGEVVQLPAQ
jgi:hypothetical protein